MSGGLTETLCQWPPSGGQSRLGNALISRRIRYRNKPLDPKFQTKGRAQLIHHAERDQNYPCSPGRVNFLDAFPLKEAAVWMENTWVMLSWIDSIYLATLPRLFPSSPSPFHNTLSVLFAVLFSFKASRFQTQHF